MANTRHPYSGAVHTNGGSHSTQSEEVQRAVTETVERNAYYAHPENFLVAMVSDSETSVRDEGVDKLLAARKQNSGTTAGSIRQFRVPELNWEAESYPDMIKWEETNVTEPPVTALLADSAIEAARGQPLELPSFPCHAQSVERCVKLVTEASRAAIFAIFGSLT